MQQQQQQQQKLQKRLRQEVVSSGHASSENFQCASGAT
jgi:hypothetical protein